MRRLVRRQGRTDGPGAMGKLVCPCRSVLAHGQADACPWHPFRSTRARHFSVDGALVGFQLAVVCLILVSGTSYAGERIDPNNPPNGLFSDEWHEVYLLGGKVGYGHSTMSREGDRVRTFAIMFTKLERAGIKLEITTTQRTLESLDGQPLEFETIMEMGKQPTRMKGKISEGKVSIVTSQFGMEQTRSFDFVPGSLMTWGTYRETLLRGFERGTEYSLSTYVPDMRLDAPIIARFLVGQEEEYTHRGHKRRGRKVVSTLQAPQGEIDTLSWVDANGSAAKTVVNMMGLTMEIFLVDQETAMADFVPPEFFISTAIPSNRTINAKTANRISYRLSLTKGSKPMPEIPRTGMQSVVKRDDRSVELLILRQDHKAIAGAAPSITASVGNEYLSGNVIMNIDDPALIKLAERAAGNAREPIELATKLREFVTDYIDDKSLGIAFATASEVCRAKEGDCTEHAVLLAALGRIKGLPSRVATGIAYVTSFAGKRDIFGFHMWTQFWIGDRWVDFDAALRESQCSPTRIAFSVSSLKDAGLADIAFALMDVIGRIDVEVLEIDGK